MLRRTRVRVFSRLTLLLSTSIPLKERARRGRPSARVVVSGSSEGVAGTGANGGSSVGAADGSSGVGTIEVAVDVHHGLLVEYLSGWGWGGGGGGDESC